MNASYLYSLLAVVVLGLVAYLGAGAAGLQGVFGIFIPYLAVVIFIAGFIYRMMDWAKSPVPFRIPTTCGQQQSLDWIKQNKIDNPSTLPGVLARMFLKLLPSGPCLKIPGWNWWATGFLTNGWYGRAVRHSVPLFLSGGGGAAPAVFSGTGAVFCQGH
ncbi:MAG: hypothetical protein R2861_07215 [Desulfobacterales bacterium]